MAQPARKSWSRSKFSAGGGNPRLFYKIQGQFMTNMTVDPKRYGASGIPEGCTLQYFDSQRHADVINLGLDGPDGRHLRQQGADLFSRVATAPQCIVLRGQIADPATFDYFRDAIGLILTCLDGGGIAVFDPLLKLWWTHEHWREVALSPTGFLPGKHTIVRVDEDEDPSMRWVYTRGMLKFGRPDISVRGVPLDLVSAAEELCDMLIDTLANGTVLSHGQELRTERLPGAWRCCYFGHAKDPEFNNAYLEVRRVN